MPAPNLQSSGERLRWWEAHRCFRGLRTVYDGQGPIEPGYHTAGNARPAWVHILGRVHAPVNGLLRHAPPRPLHSNPNSCAKCWQRFRAVMRRQP